MSRTRTKVFGSLVIAAAITLTTVGGVTAATASPQTAAITANVDEDILTRVQALPGVTDVVEAAAPVGFRFFTMNFTQRVDHNDPAKGTFKQRITLLHRDVTRPMVMSTSGYNVSQRPGRSEPTAIVDGNQLSMEYRFFVTSIPANPDWDEQLTIWQAATDQHRIIEAFKGIYEQKWLTTGGSKGGMTATYHRRFYPADVNGSIPYVAPNDVRDHQDVYNQFLDTVGTDAACRDRITALQRRTLTDRAWFLDKLQSVSAAQGYTFDIVGSMDVAMESSIVDAYFAFWQYTPQSVGCPALPDPATATNEQLWSNFYEQHSPLWVYADQSVGFYTPYYYQASFQLGAPHPYETRIGDLLKYPGADVASTFVPASLKPITFDREAMPDVDRWVRTESRNMLYVYGSNDPWSAEPFSCGASGSDRQCYRYFVSGGTHGSRISQLPEAQRVDAMTSVLRWAGLSDADPAVQQVREHRKPNWNAELDVVEVERHPGGM